ncbi:MAG: TonB-dependent receptor [Sandaracinaceae bacterium]|nr:TonB-dependent receptor [Sandaracinaceae bacterium]
MRRATWNFVLALSASMIVLVASTARADVRTEARRHFRAGMALIQEGQVDAGVAELQVAYDILPHPNVLYNIGRAYAEAGRYEEALDYFEQYMDSDPPDREEVAQFIAAIHERVGESAVAVTDPTEGTTEGTEAAVAPQVDVSEDDLRAIEDAAVQVEVLYETTGNPALQERAARLRALAESLRAGGSGATTGTATGTGTEAGTGTETGSGTATGTAALPGEQLGAQRSVFEEEIISASRFAESPIDAPNSTTTITAQDLRLSGQISLGEILRRAAGVSVMSTTPAHTDVNVRGFNQRQSNKTLVLINGRTIRLDFLATPFLQLVPFNIRDIERIEVIRGPAAALYGADAFSGIINIILKNPADAESYVAALAGSAGTFGMAASVAGREGRVGYRFGASYEHRDNFQLFVDPNRQDIAPSSPNPNRSIGALRFNADIRTALGEDQDYLLQFGTAVTSGAENTVQGIARLRELYTSDIVFAQSHVQFNTPQGIQLRGYWNAFTANVDTVEFVPGGLATDGSFESHVIDVEASFSRRFHFLVDHNLSVGAGYRFKSLDFDWGDDTTEDHYNAYLQDVLTLHERLRLTVSARVDRHPLLSKVRFSPRAALVGRLTDGSSLRATVGTAFRSPSFIESYLAFENRTPVRGATVLGVGNPNLQPERILSTELGYTNQDSDYFALEVNIYLNFVDNLIGLNEIATLPLSESFYDEQVEAFALGVTRFSNLDGRFRQLGGEIGARVFPIDGLDVYANYAISDVSPVDAAPPGLEVFFEDQRTSLHQVNGGFQYRSSIGLDLSMDLHWVSSQLWVEQYDNVETGVEYRSDDVPAYTLLNARVGWRLLDDKLELAVSGWNLLFSDVRMHPLGQRIDTRFLGHVDVRF